jgi:integrase
MPGRAGYKPRANLTRAGVEVGYTIELPSSLWETEMKTEQSREVWNKGKLVGKKPPLRPKDVWAIRIYLQNAHAVRDRALFNLAIDSKLRGCDLVSLRVRDVTHGNQVLSRAQVIQRKTQRPVQFELTESTRKAVDAWLEKAALRSEQYLFPSRLSSSQHLSTRQYARMIRDGGCSGA